MLRDLAEAISIEKVFSILIGLKFEISFLFGLHLLSGITETILAFSGNTPYFKLLFIAIERGILSISAESLANLGGILSKPVAFLVLIFLRHS